jgi:hypothetical protein
LIGNPVRILNTAWTYNRRVCMQCMLNAMAATAGASGARSWLGTRRFSWLTPARLKMITIALIAAALFASATLVSGSGAAPAKAPGATKAAHPATPSQQR